MIKYTDLTKNRKEFVIDLLQVIIESKDRDSDANKIFEIIKDAHRHLEEEKEYETNQVIIGMQHLFKRRIIKVQKGVNFNQMKQHSLNITLAKHCALCHVKC